MFIIKLENMIAIKFLVKANDAVFVFIIERYTSTVKSIATS